jgi:hypothetical protein
MIDSNLSRYISLDCKRGAAMFSDFGHKRFGCIARCHIVDRHMRANSTKAQSNRCPYAASAARYDGLLSGEIRHSTILPT